MKREDQIKDYIKEITHIQNVLVYQIRDSYFYNFPECLGDIQYFDKILEVCTDSLDLLQRYIGTNLSRSDLDE